MKADFLHGYQAAMQESEKVKHESSLINRFNRGKYDLNQMVQASG